jgi:hypothetical protein
MGRICSTQGDMDRRPKKRPKTRWQGDVENYIRKVGNVNWR